MLTSCDRVNVFDERCKRGGRARPVGDPPVGAAEHQDLDQLLEDHPVGDAGAVAPERVARQPLRYQGRELLPDGLDEVRWDGGHGQRLLRREAW